MCLPQELIDEIFSYLPVPPNEPQTFRNSSLVAKSDSISPSNLELLHHVRSLTYTLGIDSLGDYLPSFRNLESLVLSSMDLPSGVSQQVDNFSAFRHALSSLSLWSCYVSPGALITLVNYFPNLINLQLHAPMYRMDYKPSPPLSRPLRGRLSVQKFRCYDLPVLDRLSDLPPELDELVIGGAPLGGSFHTIAPSRLTRGA